MIKRISKIVDDNGGMTLVEIITSIGIIGILLIMIITIFSGNILNIKRAGDRTKNVFKAQEIIDEKISSIENANKTLKDQSLTIQFKDSNNNTWDIDVVGEVIEAKIGEGSDKVSLATFFTD